MQMSKQNIISCFIQTKSSLSFSSSSKCCLSICMVFNCSNWIMSNNYIKSVLHCEKPPIAKWWERKYHSHDDNESCAIKCYTWIPPFSRYRLNVMKSTTKWHTAFTWLQQALKQNVVTSIWKSDFCASVFSTVYIAVWINKKFVSYIIWNIHKLTASLQFGI